MPPAETVQPFTARRSPRRLLSRGVAVALIVLAVAAVIWIARAAPVGTGFYAKQLCSAVFVSGRAPEDVVAQDLAVMWPGLVFRHVDWRIDRADERVRASWLGLATREASHREGFGCTLESGLVPPYVRRVPPPPLVAEAGDHGAAFAPPLGPGPRRREAPVAAPLERAATVPALERLLDATFAAPSPGTLPATRAVVVMRHGRIVAERYAPGFAAYTRFPGWSMAKSVFNAVTGALVLRGLLDPAEAVRIAEWRAPGDPRGAITYDHLLRMSSGIAFSERYENPFSDIVTMLFLSPGAGRYAAARPLAAPPGIAWAYNGGATNTLALALLRHVPPGMRYDDLPSRLVFEPLGMTSAVAERDEHGVFIASSYVLATARDWAAFGALYAADGVRGGTRLLPEGWVAYSRTPAPADSQGRYGAHFWRYDATERAAARAASPQPLPDDAFYAAGYAGQRITIVPSMGLVVVRLGYDVGRDRFDNAAFFARVLDALGD